MAAARRENARPPREAARARKQDAAAAREQTEPGAREQEHAGDEAQVVTIKIPAQGDRRFKANVLGVCPLFDVALLELDEDEANALYLYPAACNDLPGITQRGDGSSLDSGRCSLFWSQISLLEKNREKNYRIKNLFILHQKS